MTFVPITLGGGLAGYNYLARTRETQQAAFDRNPLTSREVEQARQKLDKIQTADELLEDRTVLKVALGAFGLDDDIDNRAFIKRILESDLGDSRSLANRLTDKRYLVFAQTFNFDGGVPQLPDRAVSDDVARQLEAIQSPDDLLSDRNLLRATLERFELQDNIDNTYFLERVLSSDLDDPNAFANRFNDTRLVEFARTFDFFAKAAEAENSRSQLDRVVDTFSGAQTTITSAADLVAQPDALSEALAIFGLEDIYTTSFYTNVLNSDLNDENSFANTQDDPRFATLAAAFSFNTSVLDDDGLVVTDDEGDPVFETGTLQRFLTALQSGPTSFETPDDVMLDRPFKEATFDLFGLPQTAAARSLANRVLASDLSDPNSFANAFPDPQYKALAGFFTFQPVETQRIYPEGFVDQVVRNYMDRQFEVEVGAIDPDMRVALSLERELTQVMQTTTSNDARWFAIMSSPPLRQAIEGALRLPSSFGSIDIDQQLLVLKDRSRQFFGTDQVQEFIQPERIDQIRQDYLLSRATASTLGATSSASAASIILASF